MDSATDTDQLLDLATDPGQVRVIFLGGIGEVGKNMTVLEWGEDIIIVDVGLGFPEEEMFGIDLLLPDASYLHDKKARIRAIFITHGHEDHIGALAYLLPELGNPPIYATRLTLGLISVKLKEAKLLGTADLRELNPDGAPPVQAGAFSVEPFRVCHSIPDAVGFGITSPAGLIVVTGDYKFDQTPVDGRPTDFATLADFGRRGPLALISDCVHVESAGMTPSERTLEPTFERIFANADGRIIVATFASLISRIQQLLDIAAVYGRKVAPVGRSLEKNVDMALELGYLYAPPGTLISQGEAANLPDNLVCYIVTGSQGEPMAVLSRMANRDHRTLRTGAGDTVIISASPIPGNETSVMRIVDNLFRQGANVIYAAIDKVHVSGHASQEELKLMLNLTRPRYVIPFHGEPRHLALYSRLAVEVGVPADRILKAHLGAVLSLGPAGAAIIGDVPAGHVYVDGVTIGEVSDVVIRDRQTLSRDGVLFVAVTVDKQTGALLAGPDIASRGFVHAQGDDSFDQAKERVRAAFALDGVSDHSADWSYLTRKIKDAASAAIWEQTRRRPIVLPMVIEA
ncbi:MAG TPA: ribonuclease J [Thermomicrobiales bacterium]|nr:ribonuclease J [Thermomicrobiales bacterium]